MGRFIESGILFGVAKTAANSITTEERTGGQVSAFTSIVFSVLAVEAFLNEVIELAAKSVHKPMEPESVIVFTRIMEDLERSRASLLSRLAMSHWILSGKSVDRGSSPFQDFSVLVGLRNDLVHFKPNEDIPVETGKQDPEKVHENRLKALKSKNILADLPAGKASWTFYIGTKAVADWSCNTAYQIVGDFCSKAPASLWGNDCEDFGKRYFQDQTGTGTAEEIMPKAVALRTRMRHNASAKSFPAYSIERVKAAASATIALLTAAFEFVLHSENGNCENQGSRKIA
jgi:hypothetical protein